MKKLLIIFLMLMTFRLFAQPTDQWKFLTARSWSQLNNAQRYLYCQGFYEGMVLILGNDIGEGRRPKGDQLDFDIKTLTPLFILDLINGYYQMNPDDFSYWPYNIVSNWQTGGHEN